MQIYLRTDENNCIFENIRHRVDGAIEVSLSLGAQHSRAFVLLVSGANPGPFLDLLLVRCSPRSKTEPVYRSLVYDTDFWDFDSTDYLLLVRVSENWT